MEDHMKGTWSLETFVLLLTIISHGIGIRGVCFLKDETPLEREERLHHSWEMLNRVRQSRTQVAPARNVVLDMGMTFHAYIYFREFQISGNIISFNRCLRLIWKASLNIKPST